MSDKMLVATRKGLLTLAKKNGSWSIVRTDFPGVPVTAVMHDARDGTLYALLKHGHFGAKLHRSDDDGRSWTELPAPAFPADAAGSPTLFQIWTIETGGADEPGRLWAGASWAQLKLPGDDFGFAVVAHPKDPNTAWFVPAIKDELRVPRDGALAVTRTRDGGKTWETFRDGLPQRDAFNLIYRHGLDIDSTGKQLAMGSTTGSLWVSETAGESWQLVNAHLPPVYALRLT
jgi:hypothetical protein